MTDHTGCLSSICCIVWLQQNSTPGRAPFSRQTFQEMELDWTCVKKEDYKHCMTAMAWKPEGRRRVGRPKQPGGEQLKKKEIV